MNLGEGEAARVPGSLGAMLDALDLQDDATPAVMDGARRACPLTGDPPCGGVACGGVAWWRPHNAAEWRRAQEAWRAVARCENRRWMVWRVGMAFTLGAVVLGVGGWFWGGGLGNTALVAACVAGEVAAFAVSKRLQRRAGAMAVEARQQHGIVVARSGCPGKDAGAATLALEAVQAPAGAMAAWTLRKPSREALDAVFRSGVPLLRMDIEAIEKVWALTDGDGRGDGRGEGVAHI